MNLVPGINFFYILATLIISIIQIVKFTKADPTTKLSATEVKALAELRPLVESKVNKEYMKDDFYLIRYLRARDLNVQNAADKLLKAQAWRRENRMDEILSETIGVEKSAPYTLGSVDRSFRPVGFLRLGQWNLRRVVLAGERDKMIRVICKFLEQLDQSIIHLAQEHGKNITRFYIVLDVNNFNARDNGCLQYPEAVHKIVGVNTPRIFESIWTIIRAGMSKGTRDAVFFHGYDQEVWKNALAKDIDDDQIPVYLGGTYIENLTMRINKAAS